MMDDISLREREFDAKKAYQEACKQGCQQMTETQNFKAQSRIKATYEVWAKLRNKLWGI